MKIIHYLSIFTALVTLSCNPLEEDSRPATEISTTSSGGGGQQSWPDAPAYTTPPCNISDRHTQSDVLNFQVIYNLISTITLNNNVLHYQVPSSSNDVIDIYLYPFVQNKSTVYTLNTSATLKKYQAFIQVNCNSMDLYDKFVAKPMASPVSYVYQEYNSSSGLYTLRFCDAPLSYDFLNNIHTCHISGSFSFSY